MARGKIRFSVLLLVFSLCRPALRAEDATQGAGISADIPYWRHALGGAVIGHPVAQVESVVAATDGGNLKSFSKDGNPLWDYFARGRLTPYVSRSREGTSYICRTNGLLIAVNRSGRELWRVGLKSPLTSPVLIGWDGRLFVFTGGSVTCLTAAGYTLWSRPLEAKPAIAPVMDVSGGVILALENGVILRLDPFGNVFSFPENSAATAPAVQAEANSPAVKMPSAIPPLATASLEISGYGPSILLLFGDRHLELVYPSLRYGESLRGKLELPAAPVAATGMTTVSASGGMAPVVTDETAGQKALAAVLLNDGRVALLSLTEKKILWAEAGHLRAGEISADVGALGGADGAVKLIFDERGVYVLSKSGATGFAHDGRRLWTMRLTGAAAVPSFGDDGILYSGGADWILYAYRMEDRVRAKQRLLYGEAAEGAYGTGNPGPSSHANHYFRFEEPALEARFAEIRGAVKAGAVGDNEQEYTAWLMETALNLPPAESLSADRWNGNPPQAHTIHRMEAIRLLGFIGSGETIPFLASIFARDSDALVRAAAAEAIGKIGVDPAGLAMRAFESAVVPPGYRPASPSSDETVLAAVAGAIGALCRFSGPPLSDAGVRLLTVLAGADKPPLVRGRAQREIRNL